MDAVGPLCRLFIVVSGLIALAGCKSGDAFESLARGQSPADLPPPISPMLLPPVAPARPVPPAVQVTPAPAATSISATPPNGVMSTDAPVQGYPVESRVVRGSIPVSPINDGPVVPASMVTSPQSPSRIMQQTQVKMPNLSDSTSHIKVVALVGASNNITDQEVWELVRQHIPEYRDLAPPERKQKEKELYQKELCNLIERELLLEDMFNKITKSKQSPDNIKEIASQEAEKAVRRIQKQQGARTELEFIEILKMQGLSLAGLRRSIERQMMADEFVHSMLKETGRNPGFSDVRGYYEGHPEEFQIQDRVRWQDLFVSFNNYATPELAHARAEQLRQATLKGTDFISLIKAEEKSPPGRQNWDGIGTRREDVPLDVAPVVWSLAPGQVSGLIPALNGYHIVKVLEREYAGQKPFDLIVQNECKNKLKRLYSENDRRRLIEDLWRKGSVQIFPVDEKGVDENQHPR